jgi:hypothetical protein
MISYEQPTPAARIEDGAWYHTFDFPGIGLVQGHQDFRGIEATYLGDVDFRGKRVLEIGPANGYLTFWMERNGADVVCIDVPDSHPWDSVKRTDRDWQTFMAERRRGLQAFRNTFWLAHKLMGSRARVLYTGGYHIPDELGQFDIAVVNAVLIHTERPFEILSQAARHTTERMVVAEKLVPELEALPYPAAMLAPAPANDVFDSWWQMNRLALSSMLGLLGFTVERTSDCQVKIFAAGQRFHLDMTTLVGRR